MQNTHFQDGAERNLQPLVSSSGSVSSSFSVIIVIISLFYEKRNAN